MNRPLHGPQNPTPVDHATDTYDTIDWLVKNMPESNGKVGHPRHLLRRLPAADGAGQPAPGAQGGRADEPDGRRLDGRRLVPQRRLPPAEHVLHLRAGGHARQQREVVDQPLRRLRHVHAGRLGRRAGPDAAGSSRSASGARSSAHPSYDAFWRDQAMDKMLAGAAAQGADDAGPQPVGRRRTSTAPSPSTRRSSPRTPATTWCSWCWAPGTTARRSRTAARSARSGSTATPSLYFQRQILRPFLDHYLKDGAPEVRRARRSPRSRPAPTPGAGCDAWPAGLRPAAARVKPTPLYLLAGSSSASPRPTSGDAPFDEYISDPAKPVPFRARPIQPVGYDNGLTWPDWLVDDQREASGRPDVLVVHLRRADGAGQDQRAAGGQPDRLDQRHRRRLGRQADRRLPRRGGRRSRRWAAIS